MSDLTVVCAITEHPRWLRWGRRALDSIKRYAPDLPALLVTYRKRLGTRLLTALEPDAPYVLFLDADVIATGDVRGIPLVSFLTRRSPIDLNPAWDQTAYEKMLRDMRLPYRSVALPGHFLISRPLALRVLPRFPHWVAQYRKYRPPILRQRHKKHDQIALTLALAEAGCLDAHTTWVGPETFSWHGHNEGVGLIHHFSGATYRKLEPAAKLQQALEEARHARS